MKINVYIIKINLIKFVFSLILVYLILFFGLVIYNISKYIKSLCFFEYTFYIIVLVCMVIGRMFL